jgi:hypothetical protein
MTSGNLLQPKVTVRGNGVQTIVDLGAEKLFIRRSLDEEPREEVNLLEMGA